MNVSFTRAAEADLVAAIQWYEDQREGLGVRFAERVDEAVAVIAANPLTFPKVIGDARRIGLRKFPYNLWYRVEPDESIVIGCIHAKRDARLARDRALGVIEMPKPPEPKPS